MTEEQFFTDQDIDFDSYLEATDMKQTVKSAAVYVQGLIDRVENPQPAPTHRFMPWGKTHKLLQFRRGEVTVWGGTNGAGKSLVTGQVALSLCAQDERVCIASFEMKPMKSLERIGRQYTGHRIDDPEILAIPHERAAVLDRYAEFRDWTRNRMWFYDKQGTIKWPRVIAASRYAARELGCTQIFIDNLAKCVAAEDDFNGQKSFVDELCALARDEDIHVHLIHHVKKPATENAKPTKYDFKGSGAVTDQPDNVIAVWRNKAKEQARRMRKMLSEGEPDASLIIDKQRNGEGWEGQIALWFHPQSQQFVASKDAQPMEFFNPPEEEQTDAFGL